MELRPACARRRCGHPREGIGKHEGHFERGDGPCKAPGCACPQFVPRLRPPPSARGGSPSPAHAWLAHLRAAPVESA